MAPEYNLNIQALIPAALCAVHNFIIKFDPCDDEPVHSDTPIDHDDHYDDHVDFAETGPETNASIKHDRIAEVMWQSYQEYCAAEADGQGESWVWWVVDDDDNDYDD